MLRVLGGVGLFLSLWGFGVMMQPRQMIFTGTQARACIWSGILALLAAVSVLALTSGAGPAKVREDTGDKQ